MRFNRIFVAFSGPSVEMQLNTMHVLMGVSIVSS